jgi:hypothetical protein
MIAALLRGDSLATWSSFRHCLGLLLLILVSRAGCHTARLPDCQTARLVARLAALGATACRFRNANGGPAMSGSAPSLGRGIAVSYPPMARSGGGPNTSYCGPLRTSRLWCRMGGRRRLLDRGHGLCMRPGPGLVLAGLPGKRSALDISTRRQI